MSIDDMRGEIAKKLQQKYKTDVAYGKGGYGDYTTLRKIVGKM